jgi:uncharacterized protein (TIGR00730 family)
MTDPSVTGAAGLRICVYCSSSTDIDAGYLELADALGTALAKRGHALVSGGGSVSSMGVVARAVRAAGGHTIGIIPEALLALEVGDSDADELHVTSTMRERKAKMDASADAFIALAGGLGTLEELLEIWVARVLGLHAKPVVVLDPHGLFDLLRAQVDELVRQGFARPQARDAVLWADSVEQALDLVEAGEPAQPADGEDVEELVEGE